jgi:hypothetical protein
MTIKARREGVIEHLRDYGVHFISEKDPLKVDDMRQLQAGLAKHTNMSGLKYESSISEYLAVASDIEIMKVNPVHVIVKTELHQRLWAYAKTKWSIPLTNGYGRRIRILVFDRQNDKLIGIVGLADPLIGLGARDEYIGWTKEQKLKRLYNCMTAYVLGAVPPYNKIMGAKLIALSLLWPSIRKLVYAKYKDTTPIISGERKVPYLVYIDTLGAFGKSAIYNRLLNWKFVGYTKGQSHIHITANGSWDSIKSLVPENVFRTYKYGSGPNWKLRILKAGLKELGFSEQMLGIGWRRGYYACPLASNWREFLKGEAKIPQYINFEREELIEYWKNRWIIPRYSSLVRNLGSCN